MHRLWAALLACLVGKAAAAMSASSPTAFVVSVVIPPAYTAGYEMTHESLMIDLQTIASSVASTFNNIETVKKRGIVISFEIIEDPGSKIIPDLAVLCGTSVADIGHILDRQNLEDNTHNYIIFLPCYSTPYNQVFRSMRISVPIIESRISLECAKRVAIFYESKFSSLMATFGNALIRILGGPLGSYISTTETSVGDHGIKLSPNVADSIADFILNDVCFQQSINAT